MQRKTKATMAFIVTVACGILSVSAAEIDIAKFKGDCFRDSGLLVPVSWGCEKNPSHKVCSGERTKKIAFACLLPDKNIRVSQIIGK